MIAKLNNYAVITGAGKGLGMCFTESLAKRGYNVILVSLHNENLEEECQRLENTYKIKAEHFETDLTSTEEIDKLADWIEKNFSISVLVNNAGIGGSGEFDNTDLETLDKMILLNVRATTRITHRLLPLLRKNKHCYILNVSSMASFSPFAYKVVYAASKVYVEYLSKGLRKEFSNRGVHVSTVHPGPMWTNTEVIERIKRQSRFGRLGVEKPDYIAETAIHKMFRRTSNIVVGNGNRIHWALMKTLPRKLVMALLHYGMKKEISR